MNIKHMHQARDRSRHLNLSLTQCDGFSGIYIGFRAYFGIYIATETAQRCRATQRTSKLACVQICRRPTAVPFYHLGSATDCLM